MAIRRFHIKRDIDVSGISGTGIVADGIQWHDGMCTIHWRGKHPTDNTHLSLQSVMDIHCHEGASKIIFDDVYVNDMNDVDISNDLTVVDVRVRAEKTFDELLSYADSKKKGRRK